MGKSRKTTVTTVTVNENFQIEMVLYYEYVVGIHLKYVFGLNTVVILLRFWVWNKFSQGSGI